MENKELIERLIKRVDYIESLEHIKHPDHIKDLINELIGRCDEIEDKVRPLREQSLNGLTWWD